jgi:serine protease
LRRRQQLLTSAMKNATKLVLAILISVAAAQLWAADTLSLGKEAFEIVTQPNVDFGEDALRSEITARVLDGMARQRETRKTRASAVVGAPGTGTAPVDDSLQDVPAPSTVIVRMRDPALQGLSDRNLPLPDAVLREMSEATSVPLLHFRAMSGSAHVLRIGRDLSRPEYETLLQRLWKLTSIDTVSRDERTHSQFNPNDPYFSYQWSFWGSVDSPTRFGVDAVSAWNITRGSSSVVVAVVDSGVRPHPDFSARLLPGYDFVSNPASSNDGDGRDANATDPGNFRVLGQCTGLAPANSNWHGTHVTGTIAATGNDGIGIAGLDWNARILPVRVLGACGGDRSDVLDGMIWAAGLPVPGVPTNPNPARVINMSLGGRGSCDAFFQEQVNRAKATGAFIVVAAGNDDDLADRFVPASCDGLITVGATDWYGERASYSNWSTVRVDVAAPGGDISWFGTNSAGILSTVNTGTQGPASADWKYYEGTSMAAPHVSGIASLMLSTNGNLSPEEIYFMLQLAAEPFPWWSNCARLHICGAGIASASNAVAISTIMSGLSLVYEFRNPLTNHYFRTGWYDEARSINNGSAGPGWVDTGDYFYTFRNPTPRTLPVCRFYSAGFNSHFYTIDQGECEFVKRDTNWRFEGFAFHAIPQMIGGCPVNSSPVYRVYNNRFAQNDVNHRFTTNLSVYNNMKLQGWLQEGIAFCVPEF